MKIKPYDTALELKNYLDKTNRTQIRDICDSLFNEREHIENLKYLTQIKVLHSDNLFNFFKPTNLFNFFKPTNLFNFYIKFHFSPFQILYFIKLFKEFKL